MHSVTCSKGLPAALDRSKPPSRCLVEGSKLFAKLYVVLSAFCERMAGESIHGRNLRHPRLTPRSEPAPTKGSDVSVTAGSSAEGPVASEHSDPRDTETATDVEEKPPGRPNSRFRRLLPSPVWRIGRLLILALLIEYLVVPQLAGPQKLVHLLTQVNPLLLLAGVGLEVGAWLSYTQLTRGVLPPQIRIRFFTLFRIQMTTLSVSHCTPGGTATGAALGYRLMTQAGIAGRDVGFALAAQGIGSAVVLNVMLWIALIVSIPVWGFSAVYLLAAIVGVLLLAASGALVFFFTRGGERVGLALEKAGSRLPFVDGTALRKSFDDVAAQLQRLGHDRKHLLLAIIWASANWLLDAASLEVFVGAFGHWVNPDGLLVAYGLANVLAVIPITPGGLGVVEATLTSLLVGFGTARGVATLGVVAYRLINFWLPIPLGGVTYLSLQVDRTGTGVRRQVVELIRSLSPRRRSRKQTQSRAEDRTT